MPENTPMVEDLRVCLVDVRRALDNVEASLSRGKEVPALDAARVVVAAAGFIAKLDKLSAVLVATNGGRGKPGQG
jgi:hypothetical protein